MLEFLLDFFCKLLRISFPDKFALHGASVLKGLDFTGAEKLIARQFSKAL
jgi:hypothetical protein